MIAKYNILIVDDEVNATKAMARQLRSLNTKLKVFNDSAKAVEYIKVNKVDLLITDYMMPIYNGIALIKYIKNWHPHALAILITGVGDFELAVNAVNQGIVYQFITKPYNPEKFKQQVKNALDKVEKNIEYKKYKDWSFKMLGTDEVDEVSEILKKNTISGLLNLMWTKDKDLFKHCTKVSKTATSFMKYLNYEREIIETISIGSLMHDIGKLAIKDQILDKPSKLDDEEFVEMRHHPIVGANLLHDLGIPKAITDIVRHHHERYDGSGYPDKLKNNEIKIGAKIVCIIDTYDALRTERSYKKAMTYSEAKRIMQEESGKIFDPEITESFFQYMDSMKGE